MKSLVKCVAVVLLSSLFVLVQSECPPSVVISPCRCDDRNYDSAVMCANFTDVSSLHDIFDKSGDWPFNQFILEYSNVMYLPASAVAKKSFRYLTIRNSTLTSLFDEAPSVGNQLAHIFLFNVKFQRGIRWDLMKNLKLRDITVEHSEFRKLGNDFGDNVGVNLESFIMVDTKTSELGDHVFNRMKNMEIISFQRSRISTLKRSMFSNPSNIFTFDFSYNRIETLPDGMFHGMPRLYDIHLQGNRLKYLSESVFGGEVFKQIKYILFYDNPLICDCSIRWFVDHSKFVFMMGNCAEPPDKRGLNVTILDPGQFTYCPKSNLLLDAIE